MARRGGWHAGEEREPPGTRSACPQPPGGPGGGWTVPACTQRFTPATGSLRPWATKKKQGPRNLRIGAQDGVVDHGCNRGGRERARVITSGSTLMLLIPMLDVHSASATNRMPISRTVLAAERSIARAPLPKPVDCGGWRSERDDRSIAKCPKNKRSRWPPGPRKPRPNTSHLP